MMSLKCILCSCWILMFLLSKSLKLAELFENILNKIEFLSSELCASLLLKQELFICVEPIEETFSFWNSHRYWAAILYSLTWTELYSIKYFSKNSKNVKSVDLRYWNELCNKKIIKFCILLNFTRCYNFYF